MQNSVFACFRVCFVSVTLRWALLSVRDRLQANIMQFSHRLGLIRYSRPGDTWLLKLDGSVVLPVRMKEYMILYLPLFLSTPYYALHDCHDSSVVIFQ